MTDYTIKIDKFGRSIDGPKSIKEFKTGDNLNFVYEPSAADLGTRMHEYIEMLHKRHPKLKIVERRVMAAYGEIPEWAKPHIKLERLMRAYGGAVWTNENSHRLAAGDTVEISDASLTLTSDATLDEPGEIDEKVWRTLQSKQRVIDDALKGPNHGEADPETETSDVRTERSRLDGGRYGARTGRWSNRQDGSGARQGEEPGEELARATRAGNRSGGRYAPAKDDASVGEADRRGVVSIFNITIKQEPMGAVAEIKAGSLWDSKGYATGYTATAPELDRLIAELGKARDQIRSKNRPKHYFGQTP